LFIATKLPSASTPVTTARVTRCTSEKKRSDQRGRQVGQRDDVRARHDDRVPLEHGPVIEERDRNLRLEHDVRGDLTRDDPAEETVGRGLRGGHSGDEYGR